MKTVCINKQQKVHYLYKCIKSSIIKLVILMNKKDLRVIKTKNNLYNTLVELMKEKQFEEIKVSDICNHALVNRSTFYAHYNDKYELLEEYIKVLKESFTKELEKNKNISNTKEYYMEMIKILLDHVEDKKEIYSSIMINNRNSMTMDIIYDVLNQDITNRLKNETIKEIPSDIMAKFYLGAIFNVGIEWLNNSTKYTKEELLKYLNLLLPEEISK